MALPERVILTSTGTSFTLLGVFSSHVQTTEYVSLELALIGVAAHSVADIHCR
jgi:hypothetical protein